ncbi:hypothetical protein H8356DRAFT_1349152 [Neocallimastix lanati (nom. inval.)]|nr:hypothetical protein H8356DRAFT_1349152 [Neocallimastix sp. JGI-2020a]
MKKEHLYKINLYFERKTKSDVSESRIQENAGQMEIMADSLKKKKYFWIQAYILCRFHHENVKNANLWRMLIIAFYSITSCCVTLNVTVTNNVRLL